LASVLLRHRLLTLLTLRATLLSLYLDLLLNELLLLLRRVVGLRQMHVATYGSYSTLRLEQGLQAIQFSNLMGGQEAPSWATRATHRVLVSGLVQVGLTDLGHSIHFLQLGSGSTTLQDAVILLRVDIHGLLVSSCGIACRG